LLEENDLLFNRTNSPDLVGKVGLFVGKAEDEITFASYLVRLRVKPNNSPSWLCYLLNSIQFWSYARSQALVSLHQANLNSRRYGQMFLPVPPEDEQDKIAERVRAESREIEKVISRIDREIDLLREYRTRLISDVVTGKLDVRAVSARMPEVEEAPADEPELAELDETGDDLTEEEI
jgi:type I restriction enzyme S subunit